MRRGGRPDGESFKCKVPTTASACSWMCRPYQCRFQVEVHETYSPACAHEPCQMEEIYAASFRTRRGGGPPSRPTTLSSIINVPVCCRCTVGPLPALKFPSRPRRNSCAPLHHRHGAHLGSFEYNLGFSLSSSPRLLQTRKQQRAPLFPPKEKTAFARHTPLPTALDLTEVGADSDFDLRWARLFDPSQTQRDPHSGGLHGPTDSVMTPTRELGTNTDLRNLFTIRVVSILPHSMHTPRPPFVSATGSKCGWRTHHS